LKVEAGPDSVAPIAVQRLTDVLVVLLVGVALAWSADVPRRLGLALYTEQFLATMLAIALSSVYLAIRANGRHGGRPSVFDLAAAAIGGVNGCYIAITYPKLVEEVAFDPGYGLWPALILLALLIEGLRRTAGHALTAIVIVFALYGAFGDRVSGALAGRQVTFERLVTQLAFDTNALLGTPLLIAATVVVVFVLFGQLLNGTGGGRFFTDAALALMGRFRGGSAKIAIVASSLFGAISGSAVSNVVTTGTITIPLMQRAGIAASTAAAIEAVASTGGQLAPPIMGASAFLMAEFLQIPYTEVILAALIPALLYYAALFVQADLRAARDRILAVDSAQIPALTDTLRAGGVYLLPFAVLLIALFNFNLRPETAGLWSIVTLLAIVLLRRRSARPGMAALAAMIRDAGLASLEILMITAAAGLIIGVLNLTGLSFALTLLLVQLGKAYLPLLLLVAAIISIVLGMGMPTIGVYVLLAALVAPSLVELGVEPIAAHMFVLYFGMMSMLTPPVAIAAFAAASLARAPAMRTGWEAVRFGWPAFLVPFLFVAEPSLLMLGSPWTIAVAATTAFAGVWLVSAALVGYALGPMGIAGRLAIAAAGLSLILPPGAFAAAPYLNAAGAAIGLGLFWRSGIHR